MVKNLYLISNFQCALLREDKERRPGGRFAFRQPKVFQPPTKSISPTNQKVFGPPKDIFNIPTKKPLLNTCNIDHLTAWLQQNKQSVKCLWSIVYHMTAPKRSKIYLFEVLCEYIIMMVLWKYHHDMMILALPCKLLCVDSPHSWDPENRNICMREYRTEYLGRTWPNVLGLSP